MPFDGSGQPLLASHTTRPAPSGAAGGERRYRYYVSKALHHGSSSEGLRIPAPEIEQVVAHAIAGLFDDPLHLAGLAGLELQPAQLKPAMTAAKTFAVRLRKSGRDASPLVERITIEDEGIKLEIAIAPVAAALRLEPPAAGQATFSHACPVRLTRTGRTIRLVQPSGALALAGDGVDPALLRLIARAQAWWRAIQHDNLDPTALAEREGVTDSWVIRVVRLAFLSPRVVEGIIAGRLRAGIDATALMKPETISLDWEEQEQKLLVA
jgi:site-specific DNA recombinase